MNCKEANSQIEIFINQNKEFSNTKLIHFNNEFNSNENRTAPTTNLNSINNLNGEYHFEEDSIGSAEDLIESIKQIYHSNEIKTAFNDTVSSNSSYWIGQTEINLIQLEKKEKCNNS
jgi:hypothetical protein